MWYSLNSDGKQFHKYQQNSKLKSLTMKKTTAYNGEHPGLGLGQAQNCDCVKPVYLYNGLLSFRSMFY